nr:Flp family type IVb pilin [Brevundimonas diminuta]
MRNFIARFAKDESGATAIEYGLIAALIAVVIIGAVAALGTQLKGTFEKVKDDMASPPTEG